MTIEVLLSTFNGAAWLEAQLDSLLAQTDQGFTVLVRDDGSTDRTRAILDHYARLLGTRMAILDSAGHLGVVSSFNTLLEASTAPYVMFSDQDDYWHADKIAVFRDAVVRAEAKYGASAALLVHSDLRVVDEALVEISPSFARYVGLEYSRGTKLSRMLCQNTVTGSATLINSALRRRACPLPPHAMMHDWWVALVAAAVGRIVSISRPTVDYRLHGRNAIGARPPRIWHGLGHLPEVALRARRLWRGAVAQAAAFDDRCGEFLDPKAREIVQAMGASSDLTWVRRRLLIIRYGLWQHGAARNVAHFAFS